MALLPTLVILPLLLGIAVVRWNANFDSLLIAKVNGDLAVAHQYLSRILDNTGEHVLALSNSAHYRAVIRVTDPEALPGFLRRNREKLGLDFLFVTDEAGYILASSPPTKGKVRTDWPVIAAALADAPTTKIDIFSEKELSAISPDLAARAMVELVPTQDGVPTDRNAETRGMVVHTAAPIRLANGNSRAALVGGLLLNQNLAFTDTINELVYRDTSLPEGSKGTVALFLDDVRISAPALGTRVSAGVRKTVLDDGKTWLDRAFVVDDWYISGYAPVVDSYGKRAGMLYVGFLETPFTQTKHVTLATIAAAFLAASLIGVPIFLRWARGIFKPLERIADTIEEVESGDLGARTGLVTGPSEISRVAAHLDGLLDRIQQREREPRA